MNDSIFKIGAQGINAEQIVAEIQAKVRTKMEAGLYDDARLAQAERTNLVNLRKQEDFLNYYLRCLRDAVFVDISDFPIRERRSFLAPLMILLKKTIWTMLKFYTYRLWSQQNQVNGLIITAVEGLRDQQTEKIAQLEERIRQLEGAPRSSAQETQHE